MRLGWFVRLPHNAGLFHQKDLHCEVAQQILESFSDTRKSYFCLKFTEGPPLNYPTMLHVRLGWVRLGYPTMQDYFTKKSYIVK